MASGRAQVDYTDIDYKAVTFKIDNVSIVYLSTATRGSISVDLAVTFSADDTVALCADGDKVVGKLLEVKADGFCTVQRRGFTTLPGGTAAVLTRGKAIVGALLVAAK